MHIYKHMSIKIHTYKKKASNLQYKAVQTNCNYSKNTARRLLECYCFFHSSEIKDIIFKS